jgi:hypothetical protein
MLELEQELLKIFEKYLNRDNARFPIVISTFKRVYLGVNL